MADDRKERLFRAKMCEQAERYEDMIEQINVLVRESNKLEPLNVEERNLLSIAYKNVVGSRRSAWRVICKKIEYEQSEKNTVSCDQMKTKVETELKDICGEILNLLNTKLIPNPENDEAKIFFLKMKGDYFRYMIEICDDEQSEARKELVQKSEDAYKKASDVAAEKLQPINPIRLGLALNYSVFLYEIKSDAEAACKLCKSAFDVAIGVMDDNVDEFLADKKDSMLILQLLKDNLTLWQSEMNEDYDDDDNLYPD